MYIVAPKLCSFVEGGEGGVRSGRLKAEWLCKPLWRSPKWAAGSSPLIPASSAYTPEGVNLSKNILWVDNAQQGSSDLSMHLNPREGLLPQIAGPSQEFLT